MQSPPSLVLMRHLPTCLIGSELCSTLFSEVTAADALKHTQHSRFSLNFMQVEDGFRRIMLMSITSVQSHASLTERAERQTAMETDRNREEREWRQSDKAGRNAELHMETVLCFQL